MASSDAPGVSGLMSLIAFSFVSFYCMRNNRQALTFALSVASQPLPFGFYRTGKIVYFTVHGFDF
jgi:hypothetical protein